MTTVPFTIYGYGIHVPDESYVKPEELDFCTIDTFSANIGGVLVDNYGYDQFYQTRLWAIDKNHKLEELHTGESISCVLPLDVEPLIFGDTNRTFDAIIAELREQYGEYLVDDFPFEEHLVKFEVIEIGEVD